MTRSTRCATTAARAEARLAAAHVPRGRAPRCRRAPLRDCVTASRRPPWLVERELALAGAWYEIFPRSEGATSRRRRPGSGHRARCAPPPKRLPAVAAMGFDVVYLRPIHPIGTSQPQGPNNTLIAGRATPARRTRSARAEGGHDAIHPDLGTFADFDAFVAAAARARPGGGARPRPAVLARPPLGHRAPGVVHHPRRRHDRVRREPAEEVPGHLPAELRQRPRGHLRRDPAGRAGVDRPRGHDVPRRQPAHQAAGLLGVADRRRRTRPPRGDLPVRGVHPAGDDARRSARSASTSRTRTSPGATPSRRSRSTSRRSPARPRTYMRPSFWPTTHDILPPYLQYGGPAGLRSCARCWPRRWSPT